VGEQIERGRYRQHRGREAGEYELSGDGPVSPAAGRKDRRPGDRRDGRLEQEQERYIIGRAHQQQYPDGRKGKNNVLNDNKLGDLGCKEAALLLEVQVEAAAQYDHHQGQGHSPENIENRYHEVR
jgi:hypothetical protein